MVESPTGKKLAKIGRDIASARKAIHNITSRDLRRIAKQLGRVEDSGRGKEPTFVSTLIEDANPISIPHHVKAREQSEAFSMTWRVTLSGWRSAARRMTNEERT